MNWRPKALGVVTATAALLCVSATGAAADPPTKEDFDDTFGQTVTTLCDFPVEVESHFSGSRRFFTDEAGELVRLQEHVTAQDTFTANGVTLVGEEYHFSTQLLFSGDEVVKAQVTGVLEKVRLPDGSTFIGAGRADILASIAAGVEFIVEPDSGVIKNQDAFCAALSG